MTAGRGRFGLIDSVRACVELPLAAALLRQLLPRFSPTGRELCRFHEVGRDRAMGPFGQVEYEISRRRSQRGTGLDPPLTKRLVELHGGSIELSSCPDAGTIINVRFPASRVIQ